MLSRDNEVIPSMGVQDLSDGPPDLLKDEVSVMAFEEPIQDPFGLSDSLKDEVSVMAIEEPIQDPFGLSRATTHHDMSNFNPS
ncbi:hypothetical protein V6N13_005298 [Hibiscus sabdariffa]